MKSTMTDEKKREKKNRKLLKAKYVEAGYADPKSRWYWDKDEQAYCLPLKPIEL